jgi:hypothetical protein
MLTVVSAASGDGDDIIRQAAALGAGDDDNTDNDVDESRWLDPEHVALGPSQR